MDFLDIEMEGCPAHFVLAVHRTAAGALDIAGAGRGLTRQAAIDGCRGETVERSAASRPDGLRIIDADAADLPAPPLCLPNDVWCLSERQWSEGPHPSEDLTPAGWAAARGAQARCRSWCEGRDAITGAAVFLPLANALIGGGTPTDSNGVAAAGSRDAAAMSALLELVERDAVAIWWYGKVLRPLVTLEALDESGGATLRLWLQQRERRTWLLDLTHDLETPVVCAVSCGPDGHDIAYGFAARLSLPQAALSAALEMLQTELSLRLATSAAMAGQGGGHGARLLAWSQGTDIAAMPHLRPHDHAARVAGATGQNDLPARIAARIGRAPAFIDLHGPDPALAVVRAVAPGLRPWWPRFARGRLQSVPAALGWPAVPIDEAAIGDDVILI